MKTNRNLLCNSHNSTKNYSLLKDRLKFNFNNKNKNLSPNISHMNSHSFNDIYSLKRLGLPKKVNLEFVEEEENTNKSMESKLVRRNISKIQFNKNIFDASSKVLTHLHSNFNSHSNSNSNKVKNNKSFNNNTNRSAIIIKEKKQIIRNLNNENRISQRTNLREKYFYTYGRTRKDLRSFSNIRNTNSVDNVI